MNVQIRIDNLNKITDIADKYPAIAQRHIDFAIVRSLAEIQTRAQPLTPVKTRRLWSDIQIPHLSPFQGWIGSNLPYATVVHDRYSPGVRYKNPSLNKAAVAGFLTVATKGSNSLINDVFKKALDEIVKELGD